MTQHRHRLGTAVVTLIVALLVATAPASAASTLGGQVSINQTVSDGDKLSYDVAPAPDANVQNPSLTLTGVAAGQQRNISLSSGVTSVSISGTVAPGGPATGGTEPAINVTAPLAKTTDTGEGTSDLATGDTDGDGVVEIVYEDTSDNLDIHDAQDSTTTDTGEDTSDLATGDTDGDGAVEIVHPDTNSNLDIHDPQDSTTTDTGEDMSFALATGDTDGDGAAEIIYSDTKNNLDIHDAQDSTTTDTGGDTFGPIATGDTDGDGAAEIVYNDANSNLDIHDPQDSTTTDTGEDTTDLATGDTDGDGAAEIVYKGASDNLDIHDAQDSTTTDTGEDTSGAIATVDTDGDGTAEIVFEDSNDNLDIHDPQDSTTTDTGEDTTDLATGDTDGDGAAEIIYSDTNDNLDIHDRNDPAKTTVDVDLGNDGTVEVSQQVTGTGTLAVPSLSTGSTDIALSSTNGFQSAELRVEESAEPVDPSIQITSGAGTQTVSHTGTLADGQTVDLSSQIAPTDISGGVTLDVAIQSASGLTGDVQLDYSHDAAVHNISQVGPFTTVTGASPLTVSNVTPSDGATTTKLTGVSAGADVSGGSLPIGGQATVTLTAPSGSTTTVTTTSPTRVTDTFNSLVGGQNNWEVQVTQSGTASVVANETRSLSFSAPAEVKIRNEQQPTQLVNGQTTVTLTFFGRDGTVVEKTTTNGRINMTGLPLDEEFTARAEGQGFLTRRVFVSSVVDQQSVYLLNTSANAAQIDFNVQDDTGQFQARSSRLLVEKPITRDFDGDGSNETQFDTIAGDTISNTRTFPAALEVGERYRLRVINDAGDVRELGSYTVKGPAAPVLRIGRVQLETGGRENYVADLETFSEDVDDDGTDEQFVRVRYKDLANQTDSLDIAVTNQQTNTTVLDTNVNRELGTFSTTTQVNSSDRSTFRLNWSGQRTAANGTVTQIGGSRFGGTIPPLAEELPIDPRWLSLVGFVSIVAIAGLIVIIDNAVAATVTTGWASLLTLLGIVSIPAPALGLAGAVAVTAVVGRVK